ncbi:hypothetical protein T07_1872 [Trichinella nelsoni]|uniref:Uncharacterized protein n=1 Tax=Trichinella nelsoni TaxID=6336 RepID=A0A0V0SNK8_9BILA|nr:hypothetical protein T07_1872 [Trichinella nelsoni]
MFTFYVICIRLQLAELTVPFDQARRSIHFRLLILRIDANSMIDPVILCHCQMIIVRKQYDYDLYEMKYCVFHLQFTKKEAKTPKRELFISYVKHLEKI